MNRRAVLYAELARIFAELAQLEDGPVTNEPKRPRARRQYTRRTNSSIEVSEIAMARARQIAAKMGIR